MLFTIVFNEYGATLDTNDIETAFHACDMPQLVQAVVNAETGKVLWGSLSEKKYHHDMEHKSPCTRLTAEDIIREHVQYETPLVIPSEREWVVTTRSDIGDHSLSTSFAEMATKWFEQNVSKTWLDKPFYDEIRLYHNGVVVRAAVMGHEIVL